MTNDELQSKIINFLRFPLIVGVVLIHTRITTITMNGLEVFQGNTFPVYDTVSFLVSDVIARIAVPLFFFISGFLFFYRSGGFSLLVYRHKLKRRIHSILIPYLFWNLLVVLFFFLAQTFISSLTSGVTKLIRDYSFSDWLAAFWNVNDTYPICSQFWFLRDLMVVILFSPLVYIVVKYLRLFGILVLGILWYFDWWFSLTGFSITALFFFSLGAYFSVWRYNFAALLKPYLFPSAMLYFLLVFVCVSFRDQSWVNYIRLLSILIGVVFTITLSAYFLERHKWSVNAFLVGGTFFVYAFHGMPLALIMKLCIKYSPYLNNGILLGIYCLSTVFIILVSLGIYYLLRRWFPRSLIVMTGGR